MKELKKEFTKSGGRRFKQLVKTNEIVIYEVRQAKADVDEDSVWYEVFRPRVKAATIFHDEPHEAYPLDEAFGKWAWSCSNVRELQRIVKLHWGEDFEMPSI